MPRRSTAAAASAVSAPTALPQLLPLAEVAEALSLSYWAARSLVLRGHLAAVRLPAARDHRGRDHRRILVSVADLESFIKAHREQRPILPTASRDGHVVPTTLRPQRRPD
jgi:hypothetical protein